MPSTTLTIVLAFDQPLDVGWYERDETRREFWGVVSGLSVEAADIRQVGRQQGISFGLTPAGARLLLGLPASALQGQLVSLDDVLGALGSRLYDGVASATGWAARFAELERQLQMLARESADGAGATQARGGARLDTAHRWIGRRPRRRCRRRRGLEPPPPRRTVPR